MKLPRAYVGIAVFVTVFLTVPVAGWGSCYVPIFDRSSKLGQQQQRDLDYRNLLTNNARALRISLTPNKAKYLPYETPTFTVAINNPTDRALEVPLPFDRRTSEFSQSTYRENCPHWTAPPAMVMLFHETVTEQISGHPQYDRDSNTLYVYTYADRVAHTSIEFVEATVRNRSELLLANPLHWNDRGTPMESPRTATLLTFEAAGKSYLAIHVLSNESRLEPGQVLYSYDFESLRIIHESDLAIQILSLTESPVNTLNIDFATGTGSPKRLQYSLSETTNRLFKE